MESKKRKNDWGGILVIVGFAFLSSCSTDPVLPNYEKGIDLSIDSAELRFYNQSDSFLFTHPLQVGTSSLLLSLDTNAVYHSVLHCYSKGIAQNPLIITNNRFYVFINEIAALQNNNLSIEATDVDDQNLAVGLNSTWTSNEILSDSLQVTISGWYYNEAVKGIKTPTGKFLELKIPVQLK